MICFWLVGSVPWPSLSSPPLPRGAFSLKPSQNRGLLPPGGIYIAGGIVPRLMGRVRALQEAFLMRRGRERFQGILQARTGHARARGRRGAWGVRLRRGCVGGGAAQGGSRAWMEWQKGPRA